MFKIYAPKLFPGKRPVYSPGAEAFKYISCSVISGAITFTLISASDSILGILAFTLIFSPSTIPSTITLSLMGFLITQDTVFLNTSCPSEEKSQSKLH